MALNRILIVVYVLISACVVFAWEDKPTDDISEYTWLTDEDFEGAKHLKDEEHKIDWSNMMNPNMFQGDIAGLTEEKLLEMDRTLAASLHPRRSIFKSLKRGAGLWPDGKIPYVIHKSFNKHKRQIIAAAMSDYHQKTCIRFVKAKLDQRHSPKDYIKIQLEGDGCYVEGLGNTGGPQLLNLQISAGCVQKGKVIHEFLHKLGFIHEHSRPDRDEYVTILPENIQERYNKQFRKYPLKVINNLNTSYDYGSIMHYYNYDGSKNGQKTIVTKKPGVRIGQRVGLSPVDVTRVNRLYNCHNKNPTKTTSPTNCFKLSTTAFKHLQIVSSSPTTTIPSSPTTTIPSSPTTTTIPSSPTTTTISSSPTTTIPISPTTTIPSSPTTTIPISPTTTIPSSPTTTIPTSPTTTIPSSPTTTSSSPSTEGSCEVEVDTKKHLLNNGCWALYTTNPRRIRIVSCENGKVVQIDNIISQIAFIRSRKTLCDTRQCKNKQFCICCKP